MSQHKMKVIGWIEPEYEHDEKYGRVVTNAGYVNGSIIAFTAAETNILGRLQDAIEGDIYQWFDDSTLRPPKEGGVDKALWLVYQFVKARFAVNEFTRTVENLDNTLMLLDEGLRRELEMDGNDME